MEKSNPTLGRILIILATFFWGTSLIYTQVVLESGISSTNLVSIKMFVAFLSLFIYIIFKDPSLLKADYKYLLGFLFSGAFCQSLYNLMVFKSIENSSVPMTVVLMYTSPIYVTLFSHFFFREKVTKDKIIALIFTILGAFLSITGGNISSNDISYIGTFYGLVAGLCYGTTTIVNKFFTKKYSQLTILTYTFLFAFLTSLVFSNPMVIFDNHSLLVYVFVILLGVLATSLSYLLYVSGLKLGVGPSTASIISILEIPISVIGSILVFKDNFNNIQVLGIIMVVFSILLLNLKLEK